MLRFEEDASRFAEETPPSPPSYSPCTMFSAMNETGVRGDDNSQAAASPPHNTTSSANGSSVVECCEATRLC